jgi:hypothetical protein
MLILLCGTGMKVRSARWIVIRARYILIGIIFLTLFTLWLIVVLFVV